MISGPTINAMNCHLKGTNLFPSKDGEEKNFFTEVPRGISHAELMKANPELMKFNKGTTTLAFHIKDGIIVAADSRASQGSFIASHTVQKINRINHRILGTMAGGAADCTFWQRQVAMQCRLYEMTHREEMSITAVSHVLADMFYKYRGRGLSAGTMIAGSDLSGVHLYLVLDTGDRWKGKLFSIGSGSTFAYGILDKDYKEDMTVEEGQELATKAIYHATNRDGASGGYVRVYHVFQGGWKCLNPGQDVKELHSTYNCQTKATSADEMTK